MWFTINSKPLRLFNLEFLPQTMSVTPRTTLKILIYKGNILGWLCGLNFDHQIETLFWDLLFVLRLVKIGLGIFCSTRHKLLNLFLSQLLCAFIQLCRLGTSSMLATDLIKQIRTHISIEQASIERVLRGLFRSTDIQSKCSWNSRVYLLLNWILDIWS